MGWMRVKFIPFKENWTILIDETFVIDELIKFQIPHTKDTLTDFVSVDSNYDNDFLYKLQHNEKLLKLNIDQNLKLTRELVSDMASYYDAFVEINNWDKLVSNEEITPDSNSSYQYGNQDNVLFILKILTPKIVTGYKSVIILGANIPDSMLYGCWSKLYNVKFVPNTEIANNLLYLSHQNGSRLTIKYLSELDFSKNQRNKIINEDVNGIKCLDVGAKLAQLAIKEFNSEEFLYTINNDFDDEHLKISGGTKVSVMSRGSNKYTEYNNIYFSTALNKNNYHMRMLNSLGLNKDFIQRANVVEAAYQFLMRSSLRTPDSNDDVVFICNDKFTAVEIFKFFDNCSLLAIDSLTVKKIPYESVDRNRRLKANAAFNSTTTTYTPMEFTIFMKKLSNNNIVRAGDAPKEIPKKKIILNAGYSFVVINFEGNIENFKSVALKNKIASVVYSAIDTIGYTAAIFLKDASNYDSNLTLLPLLNTYDINVYGDKLYAPSYITKGDSEFHKIYCDRTATIEKCASNMSG